MSESLTASFLQLPMNTVTDRIYEGANSIDDLWKLFHSRAELEEKSMIFSLKSSHMIIHEHEIPHSSSAHAFGLLKNYYVYSSRDQATFHESLNSRVVKSLEEMKIEFTATAEQQKFLVRNASKQSTIMHESLDKAKCNFKKSEADLITATEKLGVLTIAAEGYDKNLPDKKKDGVARDKESKWLKS